MRLLGCLLIFSEEYESNHKTVKLLIRLGGFGFNDVPTNRAQKNVDLDGTKKILH